MRARVDHAVQKLAYIPNQMASALASSRTGRIGIIVPSLDNGVFGDYLRALHEVFIPAGIEVLVLNSNYLPGREERAIFTMLGQFPEAIILAGIRQTRKSRNSLQQAGIPVVQTMELTDQPIDINIGLSQRAAGYAAARHLFDLGHRHVGQISAGHDSRSRKRIEGYMQAVAEFGATPMVVSVDQLSTVPLGCKLFNELVQRWPQASAVFCGMTILPWGHCSRASAMELPFPVTCQSLASTILNSRQVPFRL